MATGQAEFRLDDSASADRRLWHLALGLVLVGVALRILTFVVGGFTPDSDMGEAGLMGAEFLRGNVTAMYWDQSHGGTIGAVPIALLFWVGGIGPWALAVTAQLWSAAVAGTAFWYARTVGCQRGLAATVAATAWSAPAIAYLNNSRELIYFTPAIVAGLGSLAAATAGSNRVEGAPSREFGISGLLGGLALWINPGALYLVVPAAVTVAWWAFDRHRDEPTGSTAGWGRSVRPVGWWITGWVLGIAPWAVAVMVRSAQGGDGPSPYEGMLSAGFLRRVQLFVTEQLPGLAGLKLPFSETETSPYLFAPVAIPLAVLGAVLAWRSVARASRIRAARGILVALVAAPLVWTAISAVVGSAYQNLRYSYYVYPVLVLLMVAFRSTSHRRVVAAASIVGLSVLTTIGFAGVARNNPLVAAEPLARWLDSQGLDCAVDEYAFGGYAVGLASGGEVTIIPAKLESNREFRDRARKASTCAWLIADRSSLRPPFDSYLVHNEIDAADLTARLNAAGVGYRTVRLGADDDWPAAAPAFDVIIPDRVVLPAEGYLDTGDLEIVGA